MFGHLPELLEPVGGVEVDGVVVEGVLVDGVVLDGVVVDEPDAAFAIAAPPPARAPATVRVRSAVRKRRCIVGEPPFGCDVGCLSVEMAPL